MTYRECDVCGHVDDNNVALWEHMRDEHTTVRLGWVKEHDPEMYENDGGGLVEELRENVDNRVSDDGGEDDDSVIPPNVSDPERLPERFFKEDDDDAPLTATGEQLDAIGKLMGAQREQGEDDDEYRERLLDRVM